MSFSASIDTVAFNDPHAIPVRATVFDTDAELSLEEACLSTRWPPSSLPPIPRIVNPGLTPSGAEIIKSVRIAFRYALEQVRWDHGRKDTAMYYSYRTQVLNDALAQADQQYSSYAEWVDVRAKLCVEFSLGGTVPTQAGSLDAAPANSRHNSSTVSMVASNAIQSPRPSPAEQYATERSERMPCATSPPEDVSSLFQDYFHGADSMAPCLSRGEDALSRCRSHSTLRVCKDVRPRPEFSSFFEAGSFIKAVLTSPNRDANSPAMSKSFSTPSESLTWGSLPASSCRPTVTTNDVAVHISMPEGASLASKRRDALRRANSADQKREAEWLKKRLRQMVEGDVEDIEGVIDLSPAADLANQWPHARFTLLTDHWSIRGVMMTVLAVWYALDPKSVDNNLAKAHQILTTEILPAVQRFAKVTQPTRDAARFWKSFFELAAQVRVPTEGDYTETEDLESERTGEETEDTADAYDSSPSGADTTITYDSHNDGDASEATPHASLRKTVRSAAIEQPSGMPSEDSFANAVSSTPARPPGQSGGMHDSMISSEASWTPGSLIAEMRPPGEMNWDNRQLPNFQPSSAAANLEHGITSGGSSDSGGLVLPAVDLSSSASEASFAHPPISSDTAPSSSESETSGTQKPLFRRASKGKGRASTDLRTTVLRRVSKGGGGGGKTPNLSKYNPFRPSLAIPFGEDGKVAQKWDGIVDLSSEDSSLSVGHGATIPDFAKLNFSASSAEASNDGQEKQDVPKPAGGNFRFDDFSTSSIRFPPPNRDLLRIVASPSKRAADLLVQDVLAAGWDDSKEDATPAVPSPQRPWRPAGPRPSILRAMRNPLLKDDNGHGDEEDFEDDSDSFEDEGRPSVGRVYAPGPDISQQTHDENDDSFDSDMSFDGGAGGNGGGEGDSNGGVGIGDISDFTEEPQAAGEGMVEDTLFGPRGNPPPPAHGFHLEGPHTMHTYVHGGRLEDALPVQASPTPFAGDFVPLDRRGR
ncbi:DASH complex subunit ask1 [Tulasnella sp. 403]|nr:DASH complex subunit ask1 [Tulasnella sp. 403]